MVTVRDLAVIHYVHQVVPGKTILEIEASAVSVVAREINLTNHGRLTDLLLETNTLVGLEKSPHYPALAYNDTNWIWKLSQCTSRLKIYTITGTDHNHPGASQLSCPSNENNGPTKYI